MHIRHLPVLNGGKLVGILSLTDLQRLSFASQWGDEEDDADVAIYDMLSIGQVMQGKPVVVSPEETIKAVASKLTKEEFHALPVVENDKLVGIVTTTDLIRYMIEGTDNSKKRIPVSDVYNK
jgi:CBS domain-containing protein